MPARLQRQNSIRVGRARVELETGRVRVAGQVRKLDRRSLQLLRTLARRRGAVVEREAIQAEVWGHPHLSKDTLAVTVHRLRSAVGQNGDPGPLETVPGVGYRLSREPPARFAAGISLAVVACALLLATLRPGAPAGDAGVPDPVARAERLLEQGQAGNARRAERLLTSVLRARPGDARAHGLLAQAYGHKRYHALGLDRETARHLALHHAREALRLAPASAPARLGLAGILLYQDQRPQAALETLAPLLAAGEEAALQLGSLSLAALGQHRRAVAMARAWLRRSDSGAAWWHYAFVLYLAGDHEASIAAVHEADHRDPRDPHWLLAFNHAERGDPLAAAGAWRDYAIERGCRGLSERPVARVYEELLRAARNGCLAGEIPFHRALWAQGAGLDEPARHWFAQARRSDDPMFVWHDQMALFHMEEGAPRN